jgi:translation initiation factor 3 subunit H
MSEYSNYSSNNYDNKGGKKNYDNKKGERREHSVNYKGNKGNKDRNNYSNERNVESYAISESYEDEYVNTSPIKEVVIDGLAVLKIVKHCDDNLPTMVAGSLLGIDVDGVVDVTYAYPYPLPKTEHRGDGSNDTETDDVQYQVDMMKMLGSVNVDNNVVGWYQSTYLGTICTADVIDFQLGFQCSEELAGNSVVIMYDPVQSNKGSISIKAYRLSDRFVNLKMKRRNDFIKPEDIFEEIPVRIKNTGHNSAYLRCLQDSHKEELNTNSETLSMAGTEGQVEQHFELVGKWLDDLVNEQYRFQKFAKDNSKSRQDHIRWMEKRLKENAERKENGETLLNDKFSDSGLRVIPDAPSRGEPLLYINQLDRYCNQINDHVDSSFHKLFVSSSVNNN